MRENRLIILIVAALLSVGGAVYFFAEQARAPKNPIFPPIDPILAQKCGDGVCDEVERHTGVCPKDCVKEASSGALLER